MISFVSIHHQVWTMTIFGGQPDVRCREFLHNCRHVMQNHNVQLWGSIIEYLHTYFNFFYGLLRCIKWI